MKSTKQILTDPLSDDNPITVQMLGICSALAVTSSMKPAVIMSIAVVAVMCFSSTVISCIRKIIPFKIRIIVQMLVIASAVTMVEFVLKALDYDAYRLLSVFVALIVTNCIVMGRTEGFALANPPLPSFLDALGNALGYSVILIIVGSLREILGAGEWYGISLFGENYPGNGLAALPVGAFIIIGLIIWVQRTISKDLVEETN